MAKRLAYSFIIRKIGIKDTENDLQQIEDIQNN